jgi:glycine cleavage system transcriptional repressor
MFRPARKNLYLVSLHGADRPGLVYKLTAALAKHKFNISDLMTHRTASGPKAGYVLLVEGELPGRGHSMPLERELEKLAKTLSTRIQIRPLSADSI